MRKDKNSDDELDELIEDYDKESEPEIKKNPFRKREGNVIKVGGSKEAEENNKRELQKARTKATIIKLAILLVVIAVVVIILVKVSNKQYKGYKIESSSLSVYETNAEYMEFGGNLLKYTPEGASYINSNGDTVWSAGVDMNQPIAKTSGDYAVIADKGGNKVRVFNTDGLINEVTMPYSICDIDVAKQGAFAVVLESEKTNYINMYSSTGDIIYEIQTSIDKSGYPVDISISDDGQKLFTSYFIIEGVQTKVKLAAYNFGEVGQNTNADRIVGGYIFDNEVVPKVEFISNDIVAAFSDKGIIIYAMKEKPTEKAKVTYDSEIKSIFYSSEYVGTIERNEKASGDTYIMKCYDLDGNLKFEYPFSFEFERIHASAKEIILTGGASCLIISESGVKTFSYTFDSFVKSMIPTAKSREYIITFDNRTDIIRLKTKEGVTGTIATEKTTEVNNTSEEEGSEPEIPSENSGAAPEGGDTGEGEAGNEAGNETGNEAGSTSPGNNGVLNDGEGVISPE